MRISDWSSDVCSSDLRRRQRLARESQWGAALEVVQHEARVVAIAAADIVNGRPLSPEDAARIAHAAARIAEAEAVPTDRPTQQIGRASGRERVCQYG